MGGGGSRKAKLCLGGIQDDVKFEFVYEFKFQFFSSLAFFWFAERSTPPFLLSEENFVLLATLPYPGPRLCPLSTHLLPPLSLSHLAAREERERGEGDGGREGDIRGERGRGAGCGYSGASKPNLHRGVGVSKPNLHDPRPRRPPLHPPTPSPLSLSSRG